ncbi:MAG: hypothetical protein SFY32_13085 [Bacteroidota bacterium]|nr:hypothetical protein [Bacteroidota bacterium]
MFTKDFLVHTVEFDEHPIIDITYRRTTNFDICLIPEVDTLPNFIKSGLFDYKAYCECLLIKLLKLPEDQIDDFLEYQIKLVLNPAKWLKSLEKLILRNRNVLDSDFQCTVIVNKINTLYVVYNHSKQVVKKERFCFKSVKEELGKIDSYLEKLRLIKIKKTEYLQEKADHPNRYKHKYFIQLKYEEQLLIDLMNQSSLFEKSPTKSQSDHQTIDPLRINCNVNQLVDVFFQMKHEISSEGTPILNCSNEELANLIANSFLDRQGNQISRDTIRTILNPSKYEKRPKGHKRINISDSFN